MKITDLTPQQSERLYQQVYYAVRTQQHRSKRPAPIYPRWELDLVTFMEYLLTLPDWDTYGYGLYRKVPELGYVPGNLYFAKVGAKCPS